MNWKDIEKDWKQMTGVIRQKWNKLTDEDLRSIGGRKEQFIVKLQERYSLPREQAEKDLDAFLQHLPATEVPRTHTSGGGL
jgi:uncharacterized protein YjbJ (UPF0337 family)